MLDHKLPISTSKGDLRASRDIAMKTMVTVERSLKKDPDWIKAYQSQIEDMVTRGEARVMHAVELNQWEGVINYIPYFAALNPCSSSTPLRIIFDASRPQKRGLSLNQLLAKGPDMFINNLA